MRDKYIIRPLKYMLDLSYPSLNHPPGKAEWGTKNLQIDSNRISKRWGYKKDRDLSDAVYAISRFQKYDGTEYIVYLTETDLGVRKTGSGETFAYITETGDYDSAVEGIVDDAVYFDSTETISTDGVAAGDKFILDVDHSANVEADADWGTIESVDSENKLTLTENYSGTTSVAPDTWDGSEKNALIRKVYSLPTDERWSYTIIDDKFVFTNGNITPQYWDGSGYATTLESTAGTLTKEARYCLEYADRLILADMEVSGNRSPWTVRWSKNGDPTDWTDSTAGSVDFLETEDFITGLGKVGPNIIVYKENSLIFGHRTGDATDPLSFPDIRKGVGCIAPYSIVDVRGTNAFLGRDDFYIIEGLRATPVGGTIRYKFFDITTEANTKKVWGYNNRYTNEVYWFAMTTDGQYAFVWNYKENKWTIYDFADTITAVGG